MTDIKGKSRFVSLSSCQVIGDCWLLFGAFLGDPVGLVADIRADGRLDPKGGPALPHPPKAVERRKSGPPKPDRYPAISKKGPATESNA